MGSQSSGGGKEHGPLAVCERSVYRELCGKIALCREVFVCVYA